MINRELLLKSGVLVFMLQLLCSPALAEENEYDTLNAKYKKTAKFHSNTDNASVAKEYFNDSFVLYDTLGMPKAKGLQLQLKRPQSWIPEDGDRPNIVQKFKSPDKNGYLFLIQIQDLPKEMIAAMKELSPESRENTIKEINPKDFMPSGATFISSEATKFDGEQGFVLEYSQKTDRAGISIGLQMISYVFIYRNWMTSVQCGAGAKSIPEASLKMASFRKVCQKIALSIVIPEKWQATNTKQTLSPTVAKLVEDQRPLARMDWLYLCIVGGAIGLLIFLKTNSGLKLRNRIPFTLPRTLAKITLTLVFFGISFGLTMLTAIAMSKLDLSKTASQNFDKSLAGMFFLFWMPSLYMVWKKSVKSENEKIVLWVFTVVAGLPLIFLFPDFAVLIAGVAMVSVNYLIKEKKTIGMQDSLVQEVLTKPAANMNGQESRKVLFDLEQNQTETESKFEKLSIENLKNLNEFARPEDKKYFLHWLFSKIKHVKNRLIVATIPFITYVILITLNFSISRTVRDVFNDPMGFIFAFLVVTGISFLILTSINLCVVEYKPWLKRSALFKRVAFGTGCWFLGSLIYLMIFDPFSYGYVFPFNEMDANQFIKFFLFSLGIPYLVSSSLFVYEKYVK